MKSVHAQAELYLNDRKVGVVAIRGRESSFGMGDFFPNEEFAHFAPLFGRWSLLMHAEDADERLSADASDELRDVELAIDALQARLFNLQTSEWHEIGQINIDGPLIEWRERWH